MPLTWTLALLLFPPPAKPEPKQIQTIRVSLTPDEVRRWDRKESVSVRLKGVRAADPQTTGYRLFLNIPPDAQIPTDPKDLTSGILAHQDSVLSNTSDYLVTEFSFLANPTGESAPGMTCYHSFKRFRDNKKQIDPTQPFNFTILAIGGASHIAKVVIEEVSLEFVQGRHYEPPPKKETR